MRISLYFFGSTAYARPFLGELTHIKDVFEAQSASAPHLSKTTLHRPFLLTNFIIP
jgi:hypothetical protein